MTSISDLKNSIKTVTDSTYVRGRSGYNSRTSCRMITDIILDNIIELVENDRKMSKFHKSFIMGLVNRGREPIINYIENMDTNKTDKIVDSIRKIINMTETVSNVKR